MKKKVRNNKVILTSILALGCLTAASVGFSSWVIAAQDTSKTSNVSVTVADVKDHRFDVEASSNSKIQLGPSKQGTYISYSGSVPEEDLNFNFELKFTAKGSSKEFDFKSLGDQSFDIKFSFTKTLNINNNVDGKTYIDFPSESPSKKTIGTISKSGFNASPDVTTATPSGNVITYKGTLAWGSYFDNKNPSELDDSTVSKDSTKVDSYIAGLNHLKECLKDNAAFEITVYIEKK